MTLSLTSPLLIWISLISAFLAPSMTAFGCVCAITLTTMASAILAILSSVLPWPSLMDANAFFCFDWYQFL